MIIKCLYEKIEDNLLQKKYAFGIPEKNMYYSVYAINFQDNASFYCIQIDTCSFPQWVPSELFKVCCSKLSEFWIYEPIRDDDGEISNIISFPEWVYDPYFYGELIEGNSIYQDVFVKYKNKIDTEFLSPNIIKNFLNLIFNDLIGDFSTNDENTIKLFFQSEEYEFVFDTICFALMEKKVKLKPSFLRVLKLIYNFYNGPSNKNWDQIFQYLN
jgi:hypothetical protein